MRDDEYPKHDMRWTVADSIYACARQIPCRVVGTTKRHVRIAALLRNGKESIHLVKIESLRHDPCHCFCECRVIEELKRKLGVEVS